MEKLKSFFNKAAKKIYSSESFKLEEGNRSVSINRTRILAFQKMTSHYFSDSLLEYGVYSSGIGLGHDAKFEQQKKNAAKFCKTGQTPK